MKLFCLKPIGFQCLFSLFTDDDECMDNTDNCADTAECENTIGSFICTCNTGFTGDGVTCEGEEGGQSVIKNCFVKRQVA